MLPKNDGVPLLHAQPNSPPIVFGICKIRHCGAPWSTRPADGETLAASFWAAAPASLGLQVAVWRGLLRAAWTRGSWCGDIPNPYRWRCSRTSSSSFEFQEDVLREVHLLEGKVLKDVLLEDGCPLSTLVNGPGEGCGWRSSEFVNGGRYSCFSRDLCRAEENFSERKGTDMPETRPILMTLQQVADLLGVSLSTVRRAHEGGALQATRPAPRCVRFTQASIDAWLAENTGKVA